MVSQILAELNVRPGVTREQEEDEADAEAAAAKAAVAARLEGLKEQAQALVTRKHELEVATAQERYNSLTNQLHSAHVLTQAASTVN
jgi:hypothetical protein